VNGDELVAVPAGVTTSMMPEVAVAGTVAVIFVAESTVWVAVTPLNLTAVAPQKFVPLIVTDVPVGPLVGVNDVIVGAPAVVASKFVPLVAFPPGFTTVIGPSVAAHGTEAVIWVSELIVKVDATALNCTAVVPLKPVPVSVTDVPGAPDVGRNDVIVAALAGMAVRPTSRATPTRATEPLVNSLRTPLGMGVSLLSFGDNEFVSPFRCRPNPGMASGP
jgi:hypothetical protein